MATHTVRGEPVTMPVKIRAAHACAALFTVREKPTSELMANTGLAPVQPFPGRAVCALAFVRYTDGDLGPYHEFAVTLLCRQVGQRGTAGAYVHWLPVNQSFTCEAGRSIWGFPRSWITSTSLVRRSTASSPLTETPPWHFGFPQGFRCPLKRELRGLG